MPKITAERSRARRDEIINACAELYETKSFKDLSIKDIGNAVSFTRTSVYNYFQTKEEIFLALFEREYETWNADLTSILNENDSLSVEDFAEKIARSLEKRRVLLKILSMNLYDMEENSRLEKLAGFKVVYGNSLRLVEKCLGKFFPNMNDGERQDFIYSFFPFMFGVYPYTFVTDKQREAMRIAGTNYVSMTLYEIIYSCVKNLLKSVN